jgi:Mg2+-importing ATPase
MKSIYPSHEYWNHLPEELIQQLQTDSDYGLPSSEADKRLSFCGKNVIKSRRDTNLAKLLLSQFKTPIIIIFMFTAFLSIFLGRSEDSIIIIAIVILSGLLGFWQEKGAVDAVNKLVSIVQPKSSVLRDGVQKLIPSELIVPGDIVLLKSGDSIPADSILLKSDSLFVNEATLTGESFPVEKSSRILRANTPLKDRSNSLFMGTFVVSGTAIALVLYTGFKTELGKVSERLEHVKTETEFEKGVKKFGYFLIEITLMLVISILVINVYYGRPVLDSFLFSLALAIGLSPQLLPAIISVNLSHGAKRMAIEKVIVKRLVSIENLGSMNILCSDKTGTLTIGEVKLQNAVDIEGNVSNKVRLYSYLNAFYETGFINPIDKAIRESSPQINITAFTKLGEIPYDFIRKRISVLVSSCNNAEIHAGKKFIISKGALHNVLAICNYAETPSGKIVEISTIKQQVSDLFQSLGNKGFRVLGVCYREIGVDTYGYRGTISKNDEVNMIFLGLLIFYDPIKPGVSESIKELTRLGISLKIISGDNRHVAKAIGTQVGITNPRILVGSDLPQISSDALVKQVELVDIFAEIEPHQKEQIIMALRKSGTNVVGYIGDGINDAAALRAADAGISVDSAADVVKEAADFVLLEKNLGVLSKGVQEGRRTFANTLKYVYMATSANFGNMFSMAGASLFLPFLPLLPKQILLMNLLTDLPEMTIATDNIDREIIEKPRRWDIKFIRKFMLVFGLLSTVFDYIVFFIILFVLNSTLDVFRTTWFVESIISASLIVLVIRTRKSFLKSKPRSFLLISTLSTILFTLSLPFIPIGNLFGFVPIPISYLSIIGIIVAAYIISAEVIKRFFYGKLDASKNIIDKTLLYLEKK